MKQISAIPGKPNKKIQPATLKNDIDDGLDRTGMISVAAYYHAEHRGFVGGYSLADWLTGWPLKRRSTQCTRTAKTSKSKITPIEVPVS